MKSKNLLSWSDVTWPDWIVRSPVILEQTGSTNDVAGKLAREKCASEGTLVIAETQSAGRGKRGRQWFSPAGGAIYCSLILRPHIPVSYAQVPTLIMATAAAAAIQDRCRVRARVKWPNDVLIEGRKVGGILTESVLYADAIDYLIVGMGLNCNLGENRWPEDLQSRATSISEQSGRDVERTELLVRILEIFWHDYHLARTGKYNESLRGWRLLSETLGRPVTIEQENGIISGIAEGILEDGSLQIRQPNDQELRVVTIGEIGVD